jgi:GPI mannosyltransferase 3
MCDLLRRTIFDAVIMTAAVESQGADRLSWMAKLSHFSRIEGIPLPHADSGPRQFPFRLAVFFLLLAAVPRVWEVLVGEGIFHPDEIYQSLEQAHRWIFGYGIVPWEFRYGARSWVFPGFLGIILKSFWLLGLRSAPAMIFASKFVMVAISLTGLYAAMRLAWKIAGDRAAMLTGAMAVAFAPSVLMSGRFFSETASAPMLVGAALLSYESGRNRQWLAGGLAALSIFVRYQNGLVAAALLVLLLLQRRRRDAVWYLQAAVTVGVLGGLLDWVTWGRPFHSFFVYVNFNLLKGQSGAVFGRAPFAFYLGILEAVSGPALVIMAAGFALGWARARGLFVIVAIYVLVHCIVPHKEFRFLMPVAPLAFVVAGVGLAWALERSRAARWTSWSLATLLIAVMGWEGWGLSNGDMGNYNAFRGGPESVWTWGDGVNRLLWNVGRHKDLCGALVVGLPWIWTGGYSYLHRDVPLMFHPWNYGLDKLYYGELTSYEIRAANYIIAPLHRKIPKAYVQLSHRGGLALYRRPGGCGPPPIDYSRVMNEPWLQPRYVSDGRSRGGPRY